MDGGAGSACARSIRLTQATGRRHADRADLAGADDLRHRQFTYGTSVDAAQAANARDELRAHYLARSSVSLSRLLIKIQQQFIDPVMGQVQKMLPARWGRARRMAPGFERLEHAAHARLFPARDRLRQLADGLFQRLKEEVAGLGSLIGIDTTNVKGLGLSPATSTPRSPPRTERSTSTAARAGPPTRSKQLVVYRLLMGLMYSRRFDKLFSDADNTGNFAVRTDVARAIIDWADGDDDVLARGGLGLRGLPLRRPRRPLPGAQQQLRQDRRGEDGARGLRRFHGGVPALPHRLRLGSQLQGEPGRHQQQGERRLHAAGHGPSSAPRPRPIPSSPPRDPTISTMRILYPLASILCDRASTAGFDSLSTITSLLANPQTRCSPTIRAIGCSRG